MISGIENIVGKGQNAGNWHCLLFPHCFQVFFLRTVKSRGGVEKRHVEVFPLTTEVFNELDK